MTGHYDISQVQFTVRNCPSTYERLPWGV